MQGEINIFYQQHSVLASLEGFCENCYSNFALLENYSNYMYVVRKID